jgi:hypothetical protein
MTAVYPIGGFPIGSVILSVDDTPLATNLNPARYIVDRERGPVKYRFMQSDGESIVYEVNMTRLQAARGTSLDTVAFSVQSGDITLGTAQLVGDKARIGLTMGPGRQGIVQMIALQSDGNNRIIYISLSAQRGL